MDLLIILGDIGIKISTELIKSVEISHIKACHPLVFHGTKPALYLDFLGWRIWLVIVYSRADTCGKQIHLLILIRRTVIKVKQLWHTKLCNC